MMATIEEKMQILKMLEEGKISADEAAGLLEALGDDPEVNKETGFGGVCFRIRQRPQSALVSGYGDGHGHK